MTRLPRKLLLLVILALVAVPTGLLAQSNVRPEDVRAFGAVGDGEVDDTAALQRAIDAKLGSIWLGQGTYRITSTLLVDLDGLGFTSVRGDGSGCIVMAGAGPALRFLGTHGGTANPDQVKDAVWERQRGPRVEAIEIVGAHPGACGIEARGTMQMSISGVIIRKALHGIQLIGHNRNLIISDCHIYENRGIGVFGDEVNLHQFNIVGCHISYNEQGGVVIRGGNVRNVHIGTCDIESNMASGGANASNILLDSTGGSIAEVAIVGCTIQHRRNSRDAANIRINGESFEMKEVTERRMGQITIADNILSDVQQNIVLDRVRDATITGNTMWQAYDVDVRITNSSKVVFAQNVCDNNLRYFWGKESAHRSTVIFEDCTDCTINANQLHGDGDIEAALTLRRCSTMNVTGCSVLDSPSIGLLLEDCYSSRVSDCILQRSEQADLVLRGGGGNQLADNLCARGPNYEAATEPAMEHVSDGFGFVEGPAWSPLLGELLFSDLADQTIRRLDSDGALTVYDSASGKSNGLVFDSEGVLYACLGGAREVVRVEPGGERQVLARSFEGRRLNSPNDLALDHVGGLYFTDPRYGNADDVELDVMAVYYISRDGALTRVIDSLERPNGIVVSGDGSELFVAEPEQREIWTYPILSAGELGPGRVWFRPSEDSDGRGPDGMTLDSAGNLYATYASILVIDPEGRLRRRIPIAEHPTNCVLGGAEGRTLYATARTGLYRMQNALPAAELAASGPHAAK